MASLIVILCVLSAGVGALIVYFAASWWDWRTPSGERAYKRMLRLAKRMHLRAEELKDTWSAVDLRGDRLLPLLREIRREDLILEQSTEILDRLRARLYRLEYGEDAKLPEFVHGWARGAVGRKAYPELDAATRLPGIVQVGDNVDPRTETAEWKDAAVQGEMVAGERRMLAAQEEARRPAPARPTPAADRGPLSEDPLR